MGVIYTRVSYYIGINVYIDEQCKYIIMAFLDRRIGLLIKWIKLIYKKSKKIIFLLPSRAESNCVESNAENRVENVLLSSKLCQEVMYNIQWN